MKQLIFFFLVAALFGCSQDSENGTPNLSFDIEPGNRFASSEIRVTNTSTNYEGAYRWEVTSEFGSETFNSEDLVFSPAYATQYFINLQTQEGDFEAQEPLLISTPLSLNLNRVTLKEIPGDYPELYFTIVGRSSGGEEALVYISDPIVNIVSSNPSQATWDVNETFKIFQLGTESSSLLADLKFYHINFFDGEDTFVTRLDYFTNGRGQGSEYINGPVDLTRDRRDCPGCAEFTVSADFSYSN